MKKLLLCALPLAITACSTPVQQSTVPIDMQAVQEYQQRVASGNTVSVQQKQRVAQQVEPDEPLNQSDRRPKVRQVQPVIYPSIGVGYYHGKGHFHRHHW